jgi:hypothetical protein
METIAAINLTAHRGASMNRKTLTATFVKAIVAAAFTASGILTLGTQAASAQAIVVNIPFAFSAGDQLYPVGTYQFTLLSGWQLSMRNVRGGGERFFSIGPKKDGSEGYLPGSRISVELLPYDHGTPKLRSPVQNAVLR